MNLSVTTDAVQLLHQVRQHCKNNTQAQTLALELSAHLRKTHDLEYDMEGVVNFGTDAEGVHYTASAATTLLEDALQMLGDINTKTEVLKTYVRLAQSPSETDKLWAERKRA